AAVSMLLVLGHYFYVGFERKMHMWPMRDMINTMMLVYACVGLMSLYIFFTQKSASKWLLVCTVLSFTLLAFAQTRGAMLAFISSCTLLLFLHASTRLGCLFVACLLLITGGM